MMHPLKSIAAAAVMLFALPMTANAVTYKGSLSNGTDDGFAVGPFLLSQALAGDFSLRLDDFEDGDGEIENTFVFVNDTGFDFLLTTVEGSVTQAKGSNDFFTGGVTFQFLGGAMDGTQVDEGVTRTIGPIERMLAAGSSAELYLKVGEASVSPSGSFGSLEVDFNVNASPVPVPAPLALLLTAIGGLGLMSWRRRTAEA